MVASRLAGIVEKLLLSLSGLSDTNISSPNTNDVLTWNGTTWVNQAGGGGGGSGTVTTVSVVSTNGFAGTVANATSTPAITVKTTITGLLKGDGTAISASKVTVTEPATGSTLTIQDGFTLTANANATVSGTNTGDQTITLTGDVTGSGTGSFATTVAKIKGTTVSSTTGTTNVVFSASPTLTGTPVTPTAAAGTGGTQIASQAYADTSAANAAATANAGDAADYATAAILPNSPIYNNGASGIGATITTLTTNTGLVVDGNTVSLGQEVLVKNEGDGGGLGAAKNGLYSLTTAPALGVAWILTRNVDYDQASDINYTGAIYIKAGATLAGNSYALTSKVTTVGTDALTYTISSPAYTQIVQLNAVQTLTNKKTTKRVTTAADATSITPNTDSADITYQSNSQAAGTLTINADGGSGQTEGQAWLLKVLCTNAQTFAWNTQYKGGTTALPTATTGGSKVDYFTFIWDSVNSVWRFTGQALGF